MNLESKVKNTIKKYNMFNKKEKLVVAFSGGKDSMVILYLLNKWGYNVHALHIMLGNNIWFKENEENVKLFCKTYNIPLTIVNVIKLFKKDIYEIQKIIKKDLKLNNCAICGIIKRWLTNKEAKKLKASKVITGHNLDDESQAILMNLFKGSLTTRFSLPLLNKVEGFIPRAKPLYFIKEEEIKEYSLKKNFKVVYRPCPYAEGAYRRFFRDLLNKFEKKYPKVKENIVKSYLKLINNLPNHWKPKVCKICGEPSKTDICKACQLVSKVVDKKTL